MQSLADNDPDVDAIYRLTSSLPLTFRNEWETRAVPVGTMSPFNAQVSGIDEFQVLLVTTTIMIIHIPMTSLYACTVLSPAQGHSL